jgi:hypothetical protein
MDTTQTAAAVAGAAACAPFLPCLDSSLLGHQVSNNTSHLLQAHKRLLLLLLGQQRAHPPLPCLDSSLLGYQVPNNNSHLLQAHKRLLLLLLLAHQRAHPSCPVLTAAF